MNVKRGVLAGLVVIAASRPPLALAAESAPSVEMKGGAGGLFVGGNGGQGTLTFDGYRYDFTFRGLTVGDVGAATITGAGTVHGLNRVEDFSGNYTGLGAGLTIAGGGSAVTMRNQNGVTINLVTTSRGLRARLGIGGIDIRIPPESFRTVAAEKAADRAEAAARRTEASVPRVEAAVQRTDAIIAALDAKATRHAHVRRVASRRSRARTAS